MKSSLLAIVGVLSATLAACSNFTQSIQPPLNSEISPGKSADVMAPWHFALTQSELPDAGCFRAVYPSTLWERIACSAPPHHWYPAPPSLRGRLTQRVGGGADFTADTDPTLIKKAIGAFPDVEGVKRVHSVGCCGVQGPNSYTLQLNSDFFPSSSCGSIQDCGGWEQFVLENPPPPEKGFLFIEDWLVPLGGGGLSGCPPSAGWEYVGIGCVQNSQAVRLPNVSVKDLGQLILTAAAAKHGDSIYLSVGSTEYGMRKIQSDGVVDLIANWDGAEFNIVGDAGGDVANFNAGSKITVSLQTDTGVTTAPRCLPNSGTTGETNNLFFVQAPASPPELPFPSIEFTMSSTQSSNATCDAVQGL